MKESMEFPLGYGDDTTNLQTFQPLSYIPKYNSITQPIPHSAAATGKPAPQTQTPYSYNKITQNS